MFAPSVSKPFDDGHPVGTLVICDEEVLGMVVTAPDRGGLYRVCWFDSESDTLHTSSQLDAMRRMLEAKARGDPNWLDAL